MKKRINSVLTISLIAVLLIIIVFILNINFIKISSFFTYNAKVIDASEENITQKTINEIKSSLANGLPLGGNWNSNNFDHKWQVNTLIPNGHVIMPWFGIPWQGFWDVDVSWNSQINTYETGMNFASLHKLPIAFKSPQWENGLLIDYWCNKTENENPCYQDLSGSFSKELSPLGAIEPWYKIGFASANQSYLKKIQEIYPDPPLVVFLENNEATKNDDMLACKQYMDLYGNDPRYNNSTFISEVVKEAWKVRYKEMLRGFNDGLVFEKWKANAIQIPYVGYSRTIYNVINHDYWDGVMPSSYTARYMGDRDYLVMGPQVEGGNLRFGFKYVRNNSKPNFFSDVITWYGDLTAVQGLEQIGQTFSSERYRGTSQFVLWEVQPQLLNEFRGSTQKRDGIYGLFFNILMNSVDRIHYNPTLRKFWTNGTLVVNKRPTFFKNSLPIEFANETFFVLDSDANNNTNWMSSNSQVNVFSLAYVIGNSPNREWLVYTHAPLETRYNVGITIPDYKQIFVPEVLQGGSFYLINENQNSVNEISSLNFVHNHQPIAIDDRYQVGMNGFLNITNKWATVGSKPLWFNDIDLDGDKLNLSLVNPPKHGVLVFRNDGTFTYTPKENYLGVDSFSYKLDDGVSSDIGEVIIEVISFTRIIDDGDNGYSEENVWYNGTIQGDYQGYGSTYRHHPAGNTPGVEPVSRATWTIDNLAVGSYDVFITWAPSWSRTTGAPYSVYDGSKKLINVSINQQNSPIGIMIGNTTWQKIGTYNFSSGKLKVQVTSECPWVVQGKTVVVADAIRVVNSNSLIDYYVDNTDPGYNETSYWNPESSASAYGGDRRLEINVDDRDKLFEKKAIWTFNNLVPGIYEIFTTWTPSGLNNGNGRYYVIKDGQKFEKIFSQAIAPSSLIYNNIWFESLGEYFVNNGSIVVYLNNQGKSGRIFADATGIIYTPLKGTIIDDNNNNSGYTRIAYFHQGSLGFRNNGEFLHNGDRGGGGWDAASWTFSNLQSHPYKVYVTWQDPGGWAPNADVDYSIYLDNVLTDVIINVSQHDIPEDMKLDNFGWKYLGTYDVTNGNLKVKVSAGTNHTGVRVSADAVWLIYEGCGDNVCDFNETCLTCQLDCKCDTNIQNENVSSSSSSSSSKSSSGPSNGQYIVNNKKDNSQNKTNIIENKENYTNIIENSSKQDKNESPIIKQKKVKLMFLYFFIIVNSVFVIIVLILYIKKKMKKNEKFEPIVMPYEEKYYNPV